MKKKLYKDSSTGMLHGVLSGIAQYLNMDVTVVRAAYVIASLLFARFPGFIAYFVLAYIMPDKHDVGHSDYTVE